MKDAATIRNLLQLSQHDMALFLGVSRSHYAMYESGKRSLPSTSLQLLANLITRLPAAKASKSLPQKQLRQRKTVQLKRLLHENEYQRALTARKLEAETPKQEAAAKRRALVDFLRKGSLEGKDAHVQAILAKTSRAAEDDGVEELLKLEIRQEVLAFEKSLLEARLGETQ